MIPWLMRLNISHRDQHRINLWLPLFLLWPFVALFFLFLLPFAVMAAFILRIFDFDIRIFGLISALWSLLSSLRGLSVKVDSRRNDSKIDITIY
jgi:hypothetical protein